MPVQAHAAVGHLRDLGQGGAIFSTAAMHHPHSELAARVHRLHEGLLVVPRHHAAIDDEVRHEVPSDTSSATRSTSARWRCGAMCPAMGDASTPGVGVASETICCTVMVSPATFASSSR